MADQELTEQQKDDRDFGVPAATRPRCPFCGVMPTIEAVGRDWWRMSGDHPETCILWDTELEVPRTAEQLAILERDWAMRYSQ